MKKSVVKSYPPGSAEYVVMHGRRQMQKGKNPSLPFVDIKNPREALRVATIWARLAETDIYLDGAWIDKYICSECGAAKVKLWRGYQTLPVELLCAKCAAANQEKDIADIDEWGRIESLISGRTYEIGIYVPAIPMEDSTPEKMVYWGYLSVPVSAVAWWHRLPIRK